MAAEKEFPKTNGDIYYAGDANASYYQSMGASSLNHISVNITTSAALVIAANTNRKSLLIKNFSSINIYLGVSSGVTTSTGYLLEAGEEIYMFNKEAVYGITASGTSDIRYLEMV